MDQPLLSILVTAGLGIAWLVGKLIVHKSKQPKDRIVYEGGAPKVVTQQSKGIDLDFYLIVTGIGAVLAFFWMMKAIGVTGF